MKSLRKVHGSGLGYSLLLVALSVGKVAAAQPDADGTAASAPGSADTSASGSASAGQATGTDGTAEAAPAAKAETAKAAPSKTQGVAAETAPPQPMEPAPEPAASAPLVLEILPSSGYFPNRNRGLVGGSLWLTMHGLQFPYMAPPTSKSQVRIAISGSMWNDISFARLTPSNRSLKAIDRWLNQTRGVFRVTPSYTTKEGYFVQAQTELVANGNQFLDNSTGGSNMGAVDDAFVRAGKWDMFDITVGRFQGWEVYHYGMGLDLNTLERDGAKHPNQTEPIPQIYGVNNYWDRPDGGAGNYAAHFYPTDYLRFELLGQIGTSNNSNIRAVRPVAILDLGYLKAKAGWEYGTLTLQSEGTPSHIRQNGFGGSLQIVLDPYIEGGVNGAIGYVDNWNGTGQPDTTKSTTTTSVGAFLNGRVVGPLMLGVGANNTHWENLVPNASPLSPELHGKPNYKNHLQTFGAIQYSIWDKLFMKFVASYSTYHFEDVIEVPHTGTFTNKEYGGRLRVMYLF
jgi:hypothetical protein